MSEAGNPTSTLLPEQLHAVAEKLRKGETVAPITVREFLRWFGAQRRGIYIVESISQALTNLQLITEPDFREPWIDGEIQFKLGYAQPETEGGTAKPDQSNGRSSEGGGEPRTPTPGHAHAVPVVPKDASALWVEIDLARPLRLSVPTIRFDRSGRLF
jgi:hypothetical protein